MKIEFDTEAGVFWLDPKSREASRTNQVFGRRYNRMLDRYEFPCEFVTVMQLWNDVQPETDAAGKEAISQIQLAFEQWTNPALARIEGLFPHQSDHAVKFSLRGIGIDTSEPGTGKTRTLVYTVEKGPVLVVCPNVARSSWLFEFERVGRKVEMIMGNNATERKKLENPDVVIVGFPLVHKLSGLAPYGNRKMTDEEKAAGPLNGLFDTVIVDEAHRIKSPDAKQARAAWRLLHEAKFRYEATATPVQENPADLWSLLHAVDPEIFSSSVKFKERYMFERIGFSGYPEFAGLKPHMEQEYRNIIAWYTQHTALKDAVPTMPDFTYSTITCEMEPKQRRAYEQMQKEYKVLVEDGRIYADSSIAQRTRLLQFAHATPVIDDGQVVELAHPSSKLTALMEWLEDHKKPVVVFADSRLLINLAERELIEAGYTVGVIVGGQKENLRQSIVRQFQDGDLQVILMQSAAGSESLTLTAADTIVFLGRSDSATMGVQGEGRIRRLGQMADKLQIIDIVTAGTIESNKHQMLADKNETASRLMEVQ